MSSGLFAAACPKGHLILGTDLGAVVTRSRTVSLDSRFLQSYAALCPDASSTAFKGVSRLRPGVTYMWRTPGDGQPTSREWAGPAAWPKADLLEPSASSKYIAAFDRTLEDLTVGVGRVGVSLSGGLDSSFLAAGLAVGRNLEATVLGYVHVPRVTTSQRELVARSTSELRRARLLEQRYPDRLRVKEIRSSSECLPLDAASESSRASWLPATNPHNEVWMRQIDIQAEEDGVQLLLTGTHGNYAYSNHHAYATRYLLDQRRYVAALTTALPTRGRAKTIRAMVRLLRTMRQPDVGGNWPGGEEYMKLIGMRPGLSLPHQPPHGTRTEYLLELADCVSGFAAQDQPGRWVVPHADPFRGRAVLETAARIDPRVWMGRDSRVLGYRGYARLLAAGRVPDAIRLVPSPSIQGTDAWLSMKPVKDRYLDEARALRTAPELPLWLDTGRIVALVDAWDWESEVSPPMLEVAAVNRVLHLADFIRTAETRLKRLAKDANGAPPPELDSG